MTSFVNSCNFKLDIARIKEELVWKPQYDNLDRLVSDFVTEVKKNQTSIQLDHEN